MASAWIDRSLYPFESRYFDVEAGRMHYVDEGTGDPVVMVHGNPTWSFLYRDLIKHLRERYRCVAPDHIGFGLSDKPPGWSYHPRDHAANLAALLDELRLDAITLVVQDWGGPTGLSFALEHPDRVRRIVIMNTWMWPVDDDWYYVGFSGIVGGPIGRYLTRHHNFFARVVMKQVYADASRLTDEIHRHYLEPLARPADREGCAAFPRAFVGASDWLAELWGRRVAIRQIPKFIVWGMQDVGFRPKELAAWRSAYPDAEVIELHDVGHYVQEEAPVRLNDAMNRFLVDKNDG